MTHEETLVDKQELGIRTVRVQRPDQQCGCEALGSGEVWGGFVRCGRWAGWETSRTTIHCHYQIAEHEYSFPQLG